MIVGDDEFDAVEAAPAQSEKEVFPGGAAFPVSHFDRQDLAAPVPVDANGDQHRLAHDHTALAHLLIPGVEDEVGKGLGKGAFGEGVEAFIQTFVDGGDGRGREGVAAEFLGDRLDPRVKPEGRLLRVETPCTYISASVATNACSERW